MSLTDASLQGQIVAETGDVITTDHPTGLLKETIPIIWNQYARWRTIPGMQFLQAKREAVQSLIAALRTEGVLVRVGDFEEDGGLQVRAMENLSGQLTMEIETRLKQYEASWTHGAVGTLNTIQIEPPPSFAPAGQFDGTINANDPIYRGDAYPRWTGRWGR